jgi:hypothetical protein
MVPSRKAASGKSVNPTERKNIPPKIKLELLTEAGFRCAVPNCRILLILDIHHIYEVAEGGGNEASNLIALCPTCHDLYHRGHIPRSSIFAWKSMLVAINRGFDLESIDRLMFLEQQEPDYLIVQGDGVLHFDRLIAAGLAVFEQKSNNENQIVTYAVNISPKGRMLIQAWRSGDHVQIKKAVRGTIPAGSR